MDNNINETENIMSEEVKESVGVEKVLNEPTVDNNSDNTESSKLESNTESNEVKELKTHIEELEKQLALKNAKIEEKEIKFEEAKADCNEKIQETMSIRKAIKEKAQALVAKETEVEQKSQRLDSKQNELDLMNQRLQSKQNELLKKEKAIYSRELEMSEKEATFEQEIDNKRIVAATEITEKKREFEKEISKEKEKHLTELNETFAGLRTKFEETLEKERASRLKQMDESIKKERTDRLYALDLEIAEKTKELNQKIEQLSKEKEALGKEKEELEQEQSTLEVQKRRNERKTQQLDECEDELDNIVIERMKDKSDSYNTRIASIYQECNDLREQLRIANIEQEKMQTIKAAYGSNPTIFLKTIQDLKMSNEMLLKDLAERPEKDLSKKFEELKRQNEQLKNEMLNIGEENKALTKSQEGVLKLEIQNQMISSEKENLKSQVEELENQCESLRSRISRLSSVEGRLSDRDERIKEIRNGYIKDMFSPAIPNESNEVKWLEGIRKNCKNYGISFPKRILYAFHTALKISDWSSVTVLAGVSGTGKSELPRLYSVFGGLNFINVPVQPNWDSQESMLGFFNSIDNRFDAQPLLRFLVECTEDENYREYMSIVLLDEMNLAHVEHYFAEFLSKLESRRGTSKNTVPTIEVKLGAGVEAYQLKLSRTVLWTGTMNQDETTKSLSDKVLDRGIVINFPRPKNLSSRKNMALIDTMIKETNRPMLKKGTWNKWITREINFEGEQLDELLKYKKIVEDINDALESVGRALGHRVWQSIEYYIANYPLVIAAQNEANGELTGALKAAMKIAFEDQIVQKIMPKLRGIETRGKGGKELKVIKELLESEGFEKLKDDFEFACELGYGQFMWSSAKYIEVDETDEIDTDANATVDEINNEKEKEDEN